MDHFSAITSQRMKGFHWIGEKPQCGGRNCGVFQTFFDAVEETRILSAKLSMQGVTFRKLWLQDVDATGMGN